MPYVYPSDTVIASTQGKEVHDSWAFLPPCGIDWFKVSRAL